MDISDRLEDAFRKAKSEAVEFLEKYNAVLPTAHCPQCHEKDHCPGLACPDCGYVHSPSWAILVDDEWGYRASALNNRKLVLATFPVDLPE